MQFTNPFTKTDILLGILGFFIFYNIFKPANRHKASELIQRVIDYSKFLEDTLSEIDLYLLMDDNFDEIVTEKVIPAANRLRSVRKQIEVHEKMNRPLGIPYEFMNKSMTIVDDISEELPGWELEYLLLLQRIQRTWPRLLKQKEECRQQFAFFDKDECFVVLASFKIHFQTLAFDDPRLTKEQKYAQIHPAPLQDIMDHAEHQLLPLILKFETAKVSENLSPKLDTKSDLQNPKFLKILKALMDHLLLYGPYYETVERLWLETLSEMDKKCDQATIQKGEASKTRYEDLVNGIRAEIPILKNKIKNLKYAKDKDSPNEL